MRLTIVTAANDVIDFWFDEVGPKRWFAKDAALDHVIAERFGSVHAAVCASEAAAWRDDAAALLAAVIVLDQFSRNLFRDDARAFAADPLALELALDAIAMGWHRDMPPERRAFLYMPLMHSEDRGVQRSALRRFAERGLESNIGYARAHAEVIERFGRFPGRNAALGRVSTPEEADWLRTSDPGW